VLDLTDVPQTKKGFLLYPIAAVTPAPPIVLCFDYSSA